MSRRVTPVRQIERRMPTAGRLRFGQKTGKKGSPKAIGTWRLTSHDPEAIRQAAAVYGGEPRSWEDAPTPGQWEVVTDATELDVVLPPDPLGGTPIYELWSGGGCQRRCDGVTASVVQKTSEDGAEPVEVDCICAAKGQLECEVKVRLSVILPQVRFAGVWRLDTSSWNAAHELPGMVDMIMQLQERGLTRALLGLEHRRSIQGGQTRRFIVPALRVAESLDGLAAGSAQVGAMASVEQGASAAGELAAGDVGASEGLSAGASEEAPQSQAAPPSDPDGDVVEAEIVDDETPGGASAPTWRQVADELGVNHNRCLKLARDLAHDLGEDPPNSKDEIAGRVADALVVLLREEGGQS